LGSIGGAQKGYLYSPEISAIGDNTISDALLLTSGPGTSVEADYLDRIDLVTRFVATDGGQLSSSAHHDHCAPSTAEPDDADGFLR
jgi:hypothetical protein